jgi:hypothetical protein
MIVVKDKINGHTTVWLHAEVYLLLQVIALCRYSYFFLPNCVWGLFDGRVLNNLQWETNERNILTETVAGAILCQIRLA